MKMHIVQPGPDAIPIRELPVGSFGVEDKHPLELWLRVTPDHFVCFSQVARQGQAGCQPLHYDLSEFGADQYKLIPLAAGTKIEFLI